jgi:hypothetical protein
VRVERLVEQRISENDARFRAAAPGDDPVPFLCDCPDPERIAVVPLPLERNAEIRKEPRRFLHVPEHRIDGWNLAAALLADDRYLVLETADLGEGQA